MKKNTTTAKPRKSPSNSKAKCGCAAPSGSVMPGERGARRSPCKHHWDDCQRNIVSFNFPTVLINAVCYACGGEWLENYKCFRAFEFTDSQNEKGQR